MTFEEYQKEAVKFRTESANNEEYLTLGLIEEVGEAAGKLAKRRRDGVFDEKAFIKELGDILWFVANLADYWDKGTNVISPNLADCFDFDFYDDRNDVEECAKALAYWSSAVVYDERDIDECFTEIVSNLTCLANDFGYTLEQVEEINLAKLRDRAERGKIQGNGDER